MTDFFSADADADLAVARIEEQIAEAQERARRAGEVRQEIDALRGSATSPRRELTVTVGASGRLVAVEVNDAAYRLSPRDLGRLIVETANAAQRQAGAKAVELASEAFGEESGIVAHLRDEVERSTRPAAGGTGDGTRIQY
ncbi:YbaB/EbfC family nucleoid-associated protein [Leifsonia naganoensis]|uniref:DNA-binding protein YbaB n=1 Tax=Leifsonia naganoensis TaxID=150025 RepID=A0A853DTZ9_9MICO|nr:DNA-binding protein YbaB [Leifsonia naganoensis]